jgi:neprosin-like protein
MRKKFVSLLMSLGLIVGGVVGISGPASAVSLLQASVTSNVLGKPLPALDYAHAPKGHAGSKGKFVPIVGNQRRTPCSPQCYFYGGGKQTVVSDASSIKFSVEQPSCSSTYCFHSLAENAVQSANGQQVVEWGWTVDTTGVNPTPTKPYLFAFRWVNGVPGVYNGSGWVNAVGSTCPAGMDISADVSVGSATVQNFLVQHLNGAWWTAYKGNWCGAFPDSVWTGASPPATFTQSGLIQVFGEVAAKDTVPTGVQMGSGVLGASGPSAGARASTFVLGTTVPAGVTPSLTIFNIPAVPTHYNAVLTSPSVTTFRYGGTY